MVISVLILAFLATLQDYNQIDLFESDLNKKIEVMDVSPSVQNSSNIYDHGTYKTTIREKIKPGRYRVNVEPIGDNISMNIIDGSDNHTERFNSSTTFTVDINSTIVFISIVVHDPVLYQNWTKDQISRASLKRIDQDSNMPLIPLWAMGLIGGVYIAVETCYRKRRN